MDMSESQPVPAPLRAWETPVLEDLGSSNDVAGGVNAANDGAFNTATS